MKKGQGLSMNVIVIAALAIVVLVVVTLITVNQLGLFDENFKAEKTCKRAGGECVLSADGTCPEGQQWMNDCGVDDAGSARACCKT
ncbi:MAG: hypothetical protein KJ709_08560 [Nanoarchaeota archaeon]|nr:hypothetical protein [Nanoarchaeota archaeon]